MVKEIRCYEDSLGKIHKTERDAHRAELAIWLVKTGAINEASAQQLAAKLAGNAQEMVEMLARISRLDPHTAPPLVVVA